MRAGAKLCRRKPSAQPVSAALSAATRNWPFTAAITKNDPPAIAATPAERPSMLSSRLNALVMPTTQNTVSARSAGPDPNRSTPAPTCQTPTAAAISSASRTNGPRPRCRRSSTSPTMLSATAMPSTAASSLAPSSGGRTSAATSTASESAVTIASPPRYGTGDVCALCSLGWSSRSRFSASFTMSGVRQNDSASEAAKTAAYSHQLPVIPPPASDQRDDAAPTRQEVYGRRTGCIRADRRWSRASPT